jgi:hypothetical protein
MIAHRLSTPARQLELEAYLAHEHHHARLAVGTDAHK